MTLSDNSNIKWFRMAQSESSKSTFKKYKIGAALVKGGRLLSLGHNQERFLGIGARYTRWLSSLHAERDCLSKVNKEQIKRSSIYVYRENKLGMSRLAKPCPQCLHMLKELGVKAIFYTESINNENMIGFDKIILK